MTRRTELRWRKSSHSAEQAECVEVAPVMVSWRKSSYSGGGGEDCVEIAPINFSWRKSSANADQAECVEVVPTSGACDDPHHVIAVRDSKNPNGPRLHVTAAQWANFTNKIKYAT